MLLAKQSGDIFVQKSAACTLRDLVIALSNLNYEKENCLIGTSMAKNFMNHYFLGRDGKVSRFK